jgi:hypothetical protein
MKKLIVFGLTAAAMLALPSAASARDRHHSRDRDSQYSGRYDGRSNHHYRSSGYSSSGYSYPGYSYG